MKFSIKPVFISTITLIGQLPLHLFFTIWSAGFFGGMMKAVGMFAEESPLPFVICGGTMFIIFPLIVYIAKKYNYERTEYIFNDDCLEFEEGFFTINKKTIKFRDIREVTLRRGIFQRMYGLGTIYLATFATGSSGAPNLFSAIGFGNFSASGVSVLDIENPEEVYQRIKKIIDSQI